MHIETTPLEADVSHKFYAAELGMIKDDEFELAEKPWLAFQRQECEERL